MATISIDYDSNGDVELILEEKEPTGNKTENQAAQLSDGAKAALYDVGPLSMKVKELRLRVSSLRLIASSKYFQAMLEVASFPEGTKLKQAGFLQIRLVEPEDNPTAFMIILGILYGDGFRMPTEIDLSTLSMVAVLVDKYQWHALVTPQATSWFESLVKSQGIPKSFDKSLLVWLWIAWLFGIKDHFKALSRVAYQDACGSIDPKDESIRLLDSILNAINEQRLGAFRTIEQTVENFKRDLLIVNANNPDELALRAFRYMVIGDAIFCSQNLGLGEFAKPDTREVLFVC